MGQRAVVDRRFFLIDERDGMVNATHLGAGFVTRQEIEDAAPKVQVRSL